VVDMGIKRPLGSNGGWWTVITSMNFCRKDHEIDSKSFEIGKLDECNEDIW
jgi:hypothetical protein